MNWLDIVILVVTGMAALIGWRTGIIRVVISLAAIALGIFLAAKLHGEVAAALGPAVDSETTRKALGFVIVFGVVLVLGMVASYVVRKFLHILFLGWVDRAGGMLLGVLITFAGFSALLSALKQYPILGLDKAIAGSVLGSFVVNNFNAILRLMRLLPASFGSS